MVTISSIPVFELNLFTKEIAMPVNAITGKNDCINKSKQPGNPNAGWKNDGNKLLKKKQILEAKQKDTNNHSLKWAYFMSKR